MLQENLYTLRRKAALSQEQLAEKLDVTRQTISKWEGGHSVPDLEKLQALASVFGVTLDELIGSGEPKIPQPAQKHLPAELILCLAGAAGMILLGLLSLAAPEAAARIDGASMVTINGTGLLMLSCAALMVLGTFLLLRKK